MSSIQSFEYTASTKHLPTVCQFYFKRCHSRLQFWLYNHQQLALNRLCIDIGKQASVIAIGNPTFLAFSQFYAPTPTKTVIKELQHKYPTKVVLIDERNTSKLCSDCHRELTFTKMKMSNNRQNVRVQRCRHCNKYWNCDVNAAHNMQSLYVYMCKHNGTRMPGF